MGILKLPVSLSESEHCICFCGGVDLSHAISTIVDGSCIFTNFQSADIVCNPMIRGWIEMN